MKNRLIFVNPICVFFGFIWLFVTFCTSLVYSAPIDVNEAVAVTNVWFKVEERLEKERKRIPADQDRSSFKTCFFLMADGSLEEHIPLKEEIMAYIVVYQPRGFMVISGDDRLEPIMCFSRSSTFRWDLLESSFLRTFLTCYIPCYFSQLNKKGSPNSGEHPNWIKLRAVVRGDESEESLFGDIYVLWETATWGQRHGFNDTVVANTGANCPAGCTAVTMAEKLRFHEWPHTGEGDKTWNDPGTVHGRHYVNFGSTTYDWGNMPLDAYEGTVTPDIAQLIYHCGVAQETDWQLTYGCAVPKAAPFNDHFRYRTTTAILFSGGTANKIIESIRSMLPVICYSMPEEISNAHTIVVDGYRSDNGTFHVNCGWYGDDNGWYMLDWASCCDDPGTTAPYVGALVYGAPTNYVYCDDGCGGTHTGTVKNPFATFKDGVDDVPNNGIVFLKGGTYEEAPITINRPMTLRSYYGNSTIKK